MFLSTESGCSKMVSSFVVSAGEQLWVQVPEVLVVLLL